MDTFFTILKKSLVATIFLVFTVAVTYVPQDWNDVKTAHAGGGMSTEVTQLAQWGTDKAYQGASVALETAIAFATNNDWIKENLLDGIGWSIAKGMVSSMVRSMINWINSGFEGSPMFVTNIGDFLRNAADEAMGEYIQGLGDIGSFICSPFRLDVQLAVALQYQTAREKNQPAPSCTLTGVIDNIEGFLSGAQGSFSEGGWNDWIDIASHPEVYTPLGATLAAQRGGRVAILNAQGESAFELDLGSGFLSGKICEAVEGPGGSSDEKCIISKPGKAVQEALTFNLETAPRSLIEADEFNELVSALIGQLANQAFTGAAGLLGLSGGTGYTYSGYSGGSYVDSLREESPSAEATANNIMSKLQETYSIEEIALEEATTYEASLTARANRLYRRGLATTSANANVYTTLYTDITNAITDTTLVASRANTRLTWINARITEIENGVDKTRREAIATAYNNRSWHTSKSITRKQTEWEALLRTPATKE